MQVLCLLLWLNQDMTTWVNQRIQKSTVCLCPPKVWTEKNIFWTVILQLHIWSDECTEVLLMRKELYSSWDHEWNSLYLNLQCKYRKGGHSNIIWWMKWFSYHSLELCALTFWCQLCFCLCRFLFFSFNLMVTFLSLSVDLHWYKSLKTYRSPGKNHRMTGTGQESLFRRESH